MKGKAAMNVDLKSLEQRYGTLLAMKIHEEILRADQKRFSFYQVPERIRALVDEMEEEGQPIISVISRKKSA